MTSAAGRPSVAIATVNYNTQPLLELLVRSIERYTPEPHRIYVFDNGSTDGSREYLAGLDEVVSVLAKENVGHTGGLNTLVKDMTEDVLVCLDTDAHVYREGWLSALLEELDGTVKAVGFQSGFGGDPGKVAKSLHAFCLLVDLRPFREAGKLPDFSPVVEDGRQVIDVAGRISFDLAELGFDVKILMTDEESKAVPAAARRYPDLPGREYHDGAGRYFIHHLFYGSQPYLGRRSVSILRRLLHEAYAHVQPGRSAWAIVVPYTVRSLLTPSLRGKMLRSLRTRE